MSIASPACRDAVIGRVGARSEATTNMPKYIEELVSQQIRRSELARKREIDAGLPCPTPVVTISRTMGSGARIIARKLAQDLGWSLWDRELLDAIAQDAEVSQRVVEAFDEKAVSEIELLARSALGDYESAGFLYAKHLAKAVAAVAKLGNAVILGRGANFLLPDALSIRIDASFEHRVQNMMTYENLTRQQAEAKLKASDKERQEFLVRMFGKERVERAHYDLSIWMDRFSTDDAVEIIKTTVRVWCARQRSRQPAAEKA
ncbi:MAG: cytidylate kinase-like family protein [Armatimonadota bacterium]|nr:cytidylate kinase-like family protein [Armatimonadota bacterium]